MLVDYPSEWRSYMIPNNISKKNCMFRKDTPPEIVERAKELNKSIMEASGKPFFHFEDEENDNRP